MALTSVYYDGPVTETTRAQNLAGAPEYGVYGPEDFKVTAHPSIPYAVLVKAGRAHGHGVTDTADIDQPVQCATLASGIRWDLVVVRRNWQPALGGPSTLEVIQAGTTAAIPAGRKVGPGVEDDQPLFLVKWEGGTSAPVEFIDLRVWTGNGGLYAKTDIVRTYLNKVGTSVNINGNRWTYQLLANDMPGWVNESGSGAWVDMTPNFSWGPVLNTRPRCRLIDGGRFLHVQGELLYSAGDTPKETWTVANIPAGMRPLETSFILGTTDSYNRAAVYVVGPDGAVRNGPNPAGKIAQFNGVVPLN